MGPERAGPHLPGWAVEGRQEYLGAGAIGAGRNGRAAAGRRWEWRLVCSICLELYKEPVTLLCGHNFCGACIRDWWGLCEKVCPECREPFPDGAELRRNVALSGVVEELRATPGPGPDPSHGARCPRHGQPLELFCRTEGLCVCCVCTVRECRLHERVLLDAERRAREAQLRATLEVTQQQAAQAQRQLQELQQRSSQIQVPGLSPRHPQRVLVLCPSGGHRQPLGHWAVGVSHLENASRHQEMKGRGVGGRETLAPHSSAQWAAQGPSCPQLLLCPPRTQPAP